MKIAALGDSNTGNNNDPYYVTAAQTYFQLVADALGYPQAINAGKSGHTATAMLARVQTDVIAHDPDVCLVMAGTNEGDSSLTGNVPTASLVATYISQMGGILAALQAAGIKPIVISPAFALRPRMEGRLQALRDAGRQLCLERGVAFIDLFGKMQHDSHTLSTQAFNAWFLDIGGTPDTYHMGVTGHQRLAQLIVDSQFQGGVITAPSAGVSELFSTFLSASFGNMTGNTGRIRLHANQMTAPAGALTSFRLKLQAHADEPFTVGACYIGKRTSDCSMTGAQTVKVAGASTFTVPAGTSVWSDWVALSWDKVTDLIVSVYANGGASADKMAANSGTSLGDTWLKSGNDAATESVSGYTEYLGYQSLVAGIETDGHLV